MKIKVFLSSSIILSEEIKDKKALIEKTLTQKENKQITISINTAKKGSKVKSY